MSKNKKSKSKNKSNASTKKQADRQKAQAQHERDFPYGCPENCADCRARQTLASVYLSSPPKAGDTSGQGRVGPSVHAPKGIRNA